MTVLSVMRAVDSMTVLSVMTSEFNDCIECND